MPLISPDARHRRRLTSLLFTSPKHGGSGPSAAGSLPTGPFPTRVALPWQRILLSLICLVSVGAVLYCLDFSRLWDASGGLITGAFLGGGPAADTLVMYIFSNTDGQYLRNLHFFLREGVAADDGCEYIIVVNDTGEEVLLPELPPNARYVHHPNECYDWGTFGWVLETQDVNIGRYKFFIFMNSSVRGPFLPAYLREHLHWTDLLKAKLNGEVKLVGPTISCEGSSLEGHGKGHVRKNPHVQSYVVATDAIGMQLLLEDGKVFGCYDKFYETIYYSELGSSAVILDAGYNIDCFMPRYQNVDWRDSSYWGCNMEENPYNTQSFDAIGLAPMALMFVKVKQNSLFLGDWTPRAAAQLDRWLRDADAGQQEVHMNKFITNNARYKLARVLSTAAYSYECFDCEHYVEANRDLSSFDCGSAWHHFINFGQFEGRPARYKCFIPEDELLPYFPDVSEGSTQPLPHVAPERILELLAEADGVQSA